MFFRFAHSELLYLLILIPVMVLLYVLAYTRKRKSLNDFGNPEVIGPLMPDASFARLHLKFILILLGVIALIFVIAGPQYGSKLQLEKRKGIEVIIALDVSNSMLARDIKPSRLERAKQAISRMIDQLEDDKLGLIVFAGDAYTQIPITSDFVSAKMFLSNVSTEMLSRQGTAIGACIDLAMHSFSPQSEASKVLVIISDGENHEGNAIEKAQEAAEKGIKIYTIGMGLPKGAPIPASDHPYQQDFRKDRQGSIIITRLDAKMLSQIANAGNGKYIQASTSNVGLNSLFGELKKLDKEEIEQKVYSEYEEQFQYIAAIVLLILILEFLIMDKKNKMLKGMNLFGTESIKKT